MLRNSDRIVTSAGFPAESPAVAPSLLSITVIATSAQGTLAALRKAGELAKGLGSQITLISAQVVPYALPLSRPAVPLEFQSMQFRKLAASCPVDVNVCLILCRDEMEMLKRVLMPRSIVVIGGRKGWLPNRAGRLARKLQNCHEVIFAETDR